MLLSRAFRDKWRPPLFLVVAVVLCIMLLVPFAGIAFFRVYENQLVQTTEAELIAQSAAIASVAAQRLEQVGGADLPLGPVVERSGTSSYDKGASARQPGGNWTPQLPLLDLNKTRVLPRRPKPLAPQAEVHSRTALVGTELGPILENTQKLTLAGFRVLDVHGTVIAGRDELGQSLAHVAEVRSALEGNYASVLRERAVENPQPIYSISRGTSVRVFIALPIVVNDRVAGVVYASRTPSNILKEMFWKRETVFWVSVFILGATFVVGYIFARAISGPIKALTHRSLRIGTGDREALKPLKIHGNREIHALSESMLDMSRKLFDRNDYINTFANHVTHELKSPLTAIQGAAELLADSDGLSDEDRKRFLKNILRDTERASLLLNRLRDLARADSVEIGGDSRLQMVLAEIQSKTEGFAIDCEGNADLPMSAENARIVFSNLIDNARQHSADRVVVTPQAVGNGLKVSVSDNGKGISSGNAEQVFDLFFTTRRDSGGTGMGLGIVQALLKAHGATIRLGPQVQGACFEIWFPPRARPIKSSNES
ncbi:Sensor protein CreC [Labrenzia sp. THAF82]|nr:Sensor protein CreC [Labrenzia sp. THAF82]